MWNPESFRKWQDFVNEWHLFHENPEILKRLAYRYGEVNLNKYLAKYDIVFNQLPEPKLPLIYILRD